MNTCVVDACNKPTYIKKWNLCSAHYQSKMRSGELAPRTKYTNKTCRAESCEEATAVIGLCNKHYIRMRRFGELEPTVDPRTCAACGALFVPPLNEKNRVYCTYECRIVSVNNLSKDEGARLRANTVKECAHCGEQFTPLKSLARIYCSNSCSARASEARNTKKCSTNGCDRPHTAKGLCKSHYNRKYQPDRHAKVEVHCAYCGTMTEKGKSNTKKRRPVCSDYCKSALRFPPKSELPADHWARWYGKTSAWPRYPLVQCGGCGDMFAPSAEISTCCSKRCYSTKALYDNGGMPEAERATIPRQCTDCGDTYTSPYVGQTRCKQCRRKLKRGRWITDRRRFALYQRDKYKCHICGRKTDHTAHYLDDAYPTLDHLVPRSKGGSHEDYNLSTCCRACNTQRGVDELPILQLA